MSKTPPVTRLPMRRLQRLLTRFQRAKERGKAQYQKSGELLRKMRELGFTPEVTLPDSEGKFWTLEDRYATADTAFAPAKVDRFVVKEIKPLPVRPATARKGGAE